ATAAKLHAPRGKPPPDTLVPLNLWFRQLAPAAAREGGVLAKSDAAAKLLLSEPREICVLHGDLHHGNVLDFGARGWLAIDPKGLVGERGFEFTNLLRNPDAETALAPGRLARQVRVASAAARLEPARLLAWVLAYAGLGAVWSAVSGHDAKPGLENAEVAAAELGR
ncbi:MAG: 3'-kinase, partial [Alphaproteobacteria bacterium]|nr:3'-kinase [Alphaproteobacteria bacterium]